jgi:hypothetical protein
VHASRLHQVLLQGNGRFYLVRDDRFASDVGVCDDDALCSPQMRIPTEHFANVPVFTLAPTRCSQQHSSQQSQSHASASLFSNFHLRIPQFRIHAPVDGQKDEPPNTSTPVTGGSTPSSPWFSRRRKNATVAAGSCSRPNNLSILTCSWAQHGQEQRRESLSAESTPRK